jgi:hypothetical protein
VDWTRTLCRERPAECISALAAWQVAEPVAPAREALMAAIVARAPGRSAAALREAVGEVARLFGNASGAAPSLPEVRRLTARFAVHYTHGAPFDPDALRGLWRAACRGGGAACAREFARVEAWLATGGPAPDLSASAAASGP